MLTSPLFFGLLIAFSVFIAFLALWRLVAGTDPLEARLAQYGVSAELDAAAATGEKRGPLAPLNRLLLGFGMGPKLAAMLSHADVPLTVAEFVIIILIAALSGFLVGQWRGGPLVGLLLGVIAALIPLFYVRYRENKRRQKFSEQLPDLLALLTGGLRAGYGLGQAVGSAAEQIAPPAKAELERVMRAVGLGLPLPRALEEMAARVGSDELDLVVTAINVQFELGGNLAQTLEIISETIRDRLRIKREIRVFTAQQRLTGYILALLPVAMTALLYVIAPEYIGQLFEPGLMRIVLFVAVGMQILGFLIIRRIVDIQV
jgi:tight adherence protein B